MIVVGDFTRCPVAELLEGLEGAIPEVGDEEMGAEAPQYRLAWLGFATITCAFFAGCPVSPVGRTIHSCSPVLNIL